MFLAQWWCQCKLAVTLSTVRALGGHSGTWALRGHLHTWAFGGHSGTMAFRDIGHLGTWGNLLSRLIEKEVEEKNVI